MQRVIAYVDGYNLYFGLRTRGWKRYYWLDIQRLIRSLLTPQQTLLQTRYFTTVVTEPEDKRLRQTRYLEALGTLPDFTMHYGKYVSHPETCHCCGHSFVRYSEKMTDVNIATELLSDAFQDQFDTAVLLSADSDLVAPLAKVRTLFPTKRLIVAFPPARGSKELRSVSHAYLRIWESTLRGCLFPPEVVKADGYVLRCPDAWLQGASPPPDALL